MREVNLNAVDLNLLPPLAALLKHRNVTQAGLDAGLSQPAMSRALARLRLALGDDLLVRGQAGLVPTPRALALIPALDEALENLKSLFHEQACDPPAAQRVVRIAGADLHSILLAPAIMARLAREAPGIDLRIEPYSADLGTRLETGALDLAFAVASAPLPPGVMSEHLADDRLAVVVRRGHPAADRGWTIEDYAAFDHVTIAVLGDGQSELDAQLAAAGVRRRIALTTPHFMAALAAVAETNLATTISRAFAARFSGTFGLVLRETPFAQDRLEATIIWSHVHTGDKLLRWLRGLIKEVAAGVFVANGGGPISHR